MQYKVHVDIRGVRGEKVSNNSGMVRPYDFYGRHIFRTFRVKANIITQRHGVPYRLSSDSKMLNLE